MAHLNKKLVNDVKVRNGRLEKSDPRIQRVVVRIRSTGSSPDPIHR
jgi:hypothetical protein